MVVLVGVALLFNPLFPVGLLRKQWALIDASAAILLAFHYLACKRLATTTPDAPAARARSLRRKRVTVPTPHPGRLATPARPHAVKMPVSAKDWQLLREALEKHVRAPLKTWPEVGADWKKRKEYPREYAQRGRIATNSGLLTVLSYTLLYGCMHFDALCVLMRRQEFRVPLSLALAGSGDPAVLHVDFGCGPGTASWAVVNVLSDEARITTVGHDHNRHIIRLARKMTAHLARGAARGLGLSFHYDWTGFEREVVSLSERRWSAVIVTANSLFGQVPPSAVAPIVALITEISERTGEVPLFVAGTHPPYSEVQVRDSWRRIASIPGSDIVYARRLSIVTGGPRGYDAPSWVEWTPRPQIAHIARISPDVGGHP